MGEGYRRYSEAGLGEVTSDDEAYEQGMWDGREKLYSVVGIWKYMGYAGLQESVISVG